MGMRARSLRVTSGGFVWLDNLLCLEKKLQILQKVGKQNQMFSVLRLSWKIPDGLGPIGKGLVVQDILSYTVQYSVQYI